MTHNILVCTIGQGTCSAKKFGDGKPEIRGQGQILDKR